MAWLKDIVRSRVVVGLLSALVGAAIDGGLFDREVGDALLVVARAVARALFGS